MIIHRPRWIFKSSAPATKDRIYSSLVSRSRNFFAKFFAGVNGESSFRIHRVPNVFPSKRRNISFSSACVVRQPNLGVMTKAKRRRHRSRVFSRAIFRRFYRNLVSRMVNCESIKLGERSGSDRKFVG